MESRFEIVQARQALHQSISLLLPGDIKKLREADKHFKTLISSDDFAREYFQHWSSYQTFNFLTPHHPFFNKEYSASRHFLFLLQDVPSEDYKNPDEDEDEHDEDPTGTKLSNRFIIYFNALITYNLDILLREEFSGSKFQDGVFKDIYSGWEIFIGILYSTLDFNSAECLPFIKEKYPEFFYAGVKSLVKYGPFSEKFSRAVGYQEERLETTYHTNFYREATLTLIDLCDQDASINNDVEWPKYRYNLLLRIAAFEGDISELQKLARDPLYFDPKVGLATIKLGNPKLQQLKEDNEIKLGFLRLVFENSDNATITELLNLDIDFIIYPSTFRALMELFSSMNLAVVLDIIRCIQNGKYNIYLHTVNTKRNRQEKPALDNNIYEEIIGSLMNLPNTTAELLAFNEELISIIVQPLITTDISSTWQLNHIPHLDGKWRWINPDFARIAADNREMSRQDRKKFWGLNHVDIDTNSMLAFRLIDILDILYRQQYLNSEIFQQRFINLTAEQPLPIAIHLFREKLIYDSLVSQDRQCFLGLFYLQYGINPNWRSGPFVTEYYAKKIFIDSMPDPNHFPTFPEETIKVSFLTQGPGNCEEKSYIFSNSRETRDEEETKYCSDVEQVTIVDKTGNKVLLFEKFFDMQNGLYREYVYPEGLIQELEPDQEYIVAGRPNIVLAGVPSQY